MGRRRQVGGVLLGALCLVLAGCSLTARRATSGQGQITAPVVVVGVGGLTWDGVSPEATPRLWDLLEGDAAAGAIAVRQIGPSCPADGWLSLSSGRKTAGARLQDGHEAGGGTSCAPLPEVSAGEPAGGAFVDEWKDLQERQDSWEFAPQLGLLADSLAELDVCATAVGSGAALALANGDGVVDRYQQEPKPDSFACPITVVDAGSVTDRDRDLPEADHRIGEVLDNAPEDASVLVIGVSEEPGGRPELAAAFLSGPALDGRARFLVTPTTRWDGVIRLLDVPSTLLATVGGSDPTDFFGSGVRLGGQRPAEPEETAQALEDITSADQIRRIWAGDFRTWLGAAQLVTYGLALLGVWALRKRDKTRRWMGQALVALLLWFAALPVSAYLVTVTGWWEARSPQQTLWVGMAAIAAGIAAAAGWLQRRPLWWAAGGLSLLTFGVLAADAVLFGTVLHRGSLLGLSPAFGDRFFGFGNDTFCVFMVVALLLAGAVAEELLTRDRRRLAAGAVLAIGGVTIAVDVWPAWGADIGGGLALLPGFALLALVVARIDVTAPRLAGAALGGVGLVAAVALIDWLRPEHNRAHAGRFVQTTLDGDAGEIIARKAGYAVDSLNGSLHMWGTLAVLAFLAAALLRPERWAPACLRAAFAQWSTLRATLTAIGVTILLGSFVNDYGIRIATISLTMGLPLVALTCARAGPSAAPVVTSTDPAAPSEDGSNADQAIADPDREGAMVTGGGRRR